MTDKELLDGLKRLGLVKTVSRRKKIYDISYEDVVKVSWEDIEGNIKNSNILQNELGLVKGSGGSSSTTSTSSNTYFPSGWL